MYSRSALTDNLWSRVVSVNVYATLEINNILLTMSAWHESGHGIEEFFCCCCLTVFIQYLYIELCKIAPLKPLKVYFFVCLEL